MSYRKYPAEVYIIGKHCDVPDCKLEMVEQEDKRPPLFGGPTPYLYQYRCPNGHYASDERLYPKFEVRRLPKQAKASPSGVPIAPPKE